LRAYPALVVAETASAGGQDEAAWNGFRTLAGYIFGGNARSEKIEMTAPVVETKSDAGWTILFTMPQGHALAQLPNPNDAPVRLRLAPPTRLSVIRFSGVANDELVKQKTSELVACLAAHGLQAGAPAERLPNMTRPG